jgi:co-chaperonin GroES (HSP10)
VKIRVPRDLVLLRIDPDLATGLEDDAPSAIIIPDEHQRQSARATVVAVGPGVVTRRGFKATVLEPGQRVAYPVTSGQILWAGEVEHRIMPEADVLCVFEAA